ncbi:MAG: hypothetical protein R2831_03520 [Chitinophagaceae bacterium]
MKPKLYLICFLLFASLISHAQHTVEKSKHIKLEYAQYIHEHGNQREIGDIYTFFVVAKKKGIKVLYVWFGETPVPVSIYENGKKSIHENELLKAHRMGIKCNKNIYTNFPNEHNEDAIKKQFKPSTNFRGKAMIIYSYKGKIYYYAVYTIQKLEAKPLR